MQQTFSGKKPGRVKPNYRDPKFYLMAIKSESGSLGH